MEKKKDGHKAETETPTNRHPCCPTNVCVFSPSYPSNTHVLRITHDESMTVFPVNDDEVQEEINDTHGCCGSNIRPRVAATAAVAVSSVSVGRADKSRQSYHLCPCTCCSKVVYKKKAKNQ